MVIHLAQSFESGRFHSNPWKTFPYDDPHGEWPPSPWRLLRALLARSYQLEREQDGVTDTQRAALVRAFARSSISWHLSQAAVRGPGLRQYQPAEFRRVPASAKEPGVMAYNTTKVLDNFWVTPPEETALMWIIEGDGWNPALLQVLDACLDRTTYFGRAESITTIHRVSTDTQPNCTLLDRRTDGSVPVLCPRSDVSLAQLLATTDDPEVRNSTVPPGAVWRHSLRPPKGGAQGAPKRRGRGHKPTRLIQFALGSRVAPTLDHVAMIANRFRGCAVREFLRSAGIEKGDWAKAPHDMKAAVALLAGKDADGTAIKGHRHAYFAAHLDPETGKPSRLLVWRSSDFSSAEIEAILKAGEAPISLGYARRDEKQDEKDPWRVHCVPLDSMVTPPPGFDPSEPYVVWESMTPYVPPRHAFHSNGKPKPGESPIDQLARDLEQWGLSTGDFQISSAQEEGTWVKVHGLRNGVQSNLAKRGYTFRIEFRHPVAGPLALGHSSHFGLGIFVPLDS